MRLLPVIIARAIGFGRYPSSSAAASMRSRVFCETLEPGVNARLTADWETPASFASCEAQVAFFSLQGTAEASLEDDMGHGIRPLRFGREIV